MSWWRDMAGRLLNPRSRLDRVPGFAVAEEADKHHDSQGESVQPASRVPLRAVLGNGPLVLGILIVLGLFVVVLFGQVWAPYNPYIAGQHIVPHFDREQNVFIRPPLEPSAEFPLGTDQWGTDILSMLLIGARNTLVACAFITMARVLLGVALGAIAGWNEGKSSDTFIMGLIGILSALPLLAFSMILIYALDIRRGLPVFIVALSVIGWTEIAQYTRGEFLALRQRSFIEGARGTGQSELQIGVRHVLPNILPQLLVISFLEMGAVLMLLGELGFVGVYVGGGSRIDLTEPLGPTRIYTLADVPEWGAMIADGHRWLRSKPFIVFPPAAAFFIAVVGFNALGEGLRRLIDRYTPQTAFLLQKRMILLVAGLTVATVFIMNNTGASPWFSKVAQAFDGGRVYEYVKLLAAMDGRGIGQEGGATAAAYITEQFEAVGLEPGWRHNSYHYDQEMRLVLPIEQPGLTLLDASGKSLATYDHQSDFGFTIEDHGGSGLATAPVTVIGFDSQRDNLAWDDYKGLDLRGRIVLLVRGNAPSEFPTEALIRGAAGVLWVTNDSPNAIRSQVQLADPEGNYLESPTIPIFQIRPHVAASIVSADLTSLTNFLTGNTSHNQSGMGWFTADLERQVTMSLVLGEVETLQIPSIIGYIPGSDLDVADQMVILFAPYDGLGLDPNGKVFQGANQGATGVAMMLELASLWQEQGLEARRTTMFVAWGGGELDSSGAREWLEDAFNFRHLRSQATQSNIIPSMLLQLNNLGGGGDWLQVRTSSASRQLLALIEESSTETSLPLLDGDTSLRPSRAVVSTRIPDYASFGWVTEGIAPADDTLASIDRDKLDRFGEMFALLMTKIVRESRL